MPRIEAGKRAGEPMSLGRMPQAEKRQAPVGAVSDRQRKLVLSLAEADPSFPSDPNRFKYNGIDINFRRHVYADKIADRTFTPNNTYINGRVSIFTFLDILEYPEDRRLSTVAKARNLWNELRSQNPRFESMSDSELIAHLRKRVSANPDGKTDPRKGARIPQRTTVDRRAVVHQATKIDPGRVVNLGNPARQRRISPTGHGFSDRAYIPAPDIVTFSPTVRADSALAHPLWPEHRPTNQIEKYVYALGLPGEVSDWHFSGLREIVANLNASSLEFDLSGQRLTSAERDSKIDDILEGAKMMIRKYAVPELTAGKDYYRDPIHNQAPSKMAKEVLSWLRHMKAQRKPSYEAFMQRLGEAVEPSQELHVA